MAPILVYSGFSILFLILQSTLSQFFTYQGVFPDLSFITIVYMSFTYGKFYGQMGGFIQGVTFDVMSFSPLGFNSLIGLLVGNSIGRFKGIVQLDLIILPMTIVFISTIFKNIVLIILSLLLSQSGIINSVFSMQNLIEILLTTIISWLLFHLYRYVDVLINKKHNYK